MSDLLSIGASGVRAYGAALAAVGNNVSNANTAGYTRRTVTLQENTSGDTSQVYYTSQAQFGGVVTTSVTRAWDDYQATTARTASSDAGSADAYATWMASTETALADNTTGVGQSATAVFNAGDALSADVNSSANRQGFLSALDQTATAFNQTATGLQQTSAGIAQSAQSSVSTVNSKLDTLDKVNAALQRSTAGSSGRADLEDQRDQLIDDISAQVGINVSIASNGTATLTLSGSNVQLTGGADGNGGGSRLTLATASNGALQVQAFSATSSSNVGNLGGTLGGLVQSASVVADRRNSLDKMASDFASQINAWQASGQTSAGAAGTALLSGTSAATIKLATTDTSAIAVASSTATNGNLLALSNLRTSAGLEQSWTTMVTNQGQIVSAAKTADTAAASSKDSALQARDTASGVDLDTEAAQLVRYQQAYSGAAKVIQVAKDTMQSILDLF